MVFVRKYCNTQPTFVAAIIIIIIIIIISYFVYFVDVNRNLPMQTGQ